MYPAHSKPFPQPQHSSGCGVVCRPPATPVKGGRRGADTMFASAQIADRACLMCAEWCRGTPWAVLVQTLRRAQASSCVQRTIQKTTSQHLRGTNTSCRASKQRLLSCLSKESVRHLECRERLLRCKATHCNSMRHSVGQSARQNRAAPLVSGLWTLRLYLQAESYARESAARGSVSQRMSYFPARLSCAGVGTQSNQAGLKASS